MRDDALGHGDLAYRTGTAAEYTLFAKTIQPIRKAGIPLHLGLGNHDHFERFSSGLAMHRPKDQPVDGEQVLVIDMSEERNQPLVLINAGIVEKDGAQVYQEGCLSFPGVYADVTRALKVKVKAHDVDGKEFVYEAEGPLAVAVQHELDHLAGKVFVDYLSPLKRSLLLKRLEKQRKQAASA